MNIKLSLQHHCIETEIKKQYNKAVSDYFKAGKTDEPAAELEDRIDMLHQAIEGFDFRHLRNQYRDLRGDTDAEVTLSRSASNQLRLHINGETIDAKN
ncbi:MAG: hypothetical protein ACQERN_05670 [Thermodesulfobacteriota bacterium]